MSPILELNCIVLGGDYKRIFPIEIKGTKKVGDLKDFIKDKNKPAFDRVPAHYLELFKVSFPVDDGLDAQLKFLSTRR
jgi:hypothetical protein